MQVLENISLRPYNTFGIDAKARYLVHIRSVEDLQQLSALNLIPPVTGTKLPMLILGGGSNLLLMEDFEGLVLKIDIKGIDKIKEDAARLALRPLRLQAERGGGGGIEVLSGVLVARMQRSEIRDSNR